MSEPYNPKGHGRGLVLAACLVIVIGGIKVAAPVILPIVEALFLAVVSLPVVRWLHRKFHSSILAAIFTAIIDLLLLTVLLLVVGQSLRNFVARAPQYQERLGGLISEVIAGLARYGVRTGSLQSHAFGVDNIFDVARVAAASIDAALSHVFLVFLVMVFFLIELPAIEAKLQRITPNGNASARIGQINQEVQRYVGLKVALAIAGGLLQGIWFAILGVDFPVLWGLLHALLSFVPNIGSFIALLPPLVLSLLTQGVLRTVLLLVGAVTLNTLIGNVLEPRLLGRRLGISPLVLVLTLLIWGWIWGPMGVFLSVPLTMVLRIVFEHSERSKWVATLIE